MSKKIRGAAIYRALMAALFLQFVLLPKTFMEIKLLFLAGILLTVFIMNKMRLVLGKAQLLILAFISWNIISTIAGLVHGYGYDAIRPGTVNILWPLCYLIISSIGLIESDILWLDKAIVYLTLVLCVIDTIMIVSSYLGISSVMSLLNIFNLNDVGVWKNEGFVEFRTDHMYLYAFLVPYMISRLFCCIQKKETNLSVSRKIVVFVSVYSMLVGVLTGLGGVWLAIALGLVLGGVKYRVVARKRTLMPILIILMLFSVYAICSYFNHGTVYQIGHNILSRLSSTVTSDAVSRSARVSQTNQMLELWTQRPVFGWGVGCPAEYIRNGVIYNSTQNEVGYLVRLYQSGIIGFVLFFKIVFYSFKKLRRSSETIIHPGKAFSAGLACYLVANIFNPYLTNISNYWILFLPFLITRKGTREQCTVWSHKTCTVLKGEYECQ